MSYLHTIALIAFMAAMASGATVSLDILYDEVVYDGHIDKGAILMLVTAVVGLALAVLAYLRHVGYAQDEVSESVKSDVEEPQCKVDELAELIEEVNDEIADHNSMYEDVNDIIRDMEYDHPCFGPIQLTL